MVAIRVTGPRAFLTVVGDIDTATAPELRAQLSNLITAGKYHFVIDLTDVPFVDSSGCAVFVSTLRRVRRYDGSVRLVGTSEAVAKILHLTGLDRILTGDATVPGGLAADRRCIGATDP